MKVTSASTRIKGSHIYRLLIGTAVILSMPFIAMQFTDEVQWDLRDFIVIGALLIGAGLAYELLAVRIAAKHRPIIAVIVIAVVLLAWAEMAVGIFGSPIAGS